MWTHGSCALVQFRQAAWRLWSCLSRPGIAITRYRRGVFCIASTRAAGASWPSALRRPRRHACDAEHAIRIWRAVDDLNIETSSQRPHQALLVVLCCCNFHRDGIDGQARCWCSSRCGHAAPAHPCSFGRQTGGSSYAARDLEGRSRYLGAEYLALRPARAGGAARPSSLLRATPYACDAEQAFQIAHMADDFKIESTSRRPHHALLAVRLPPSTGCRFWMFWHSGSPFGAIILRPSPAPAGCRSRGSTRAPKE